MKFVLFFVRCLMEKYLPVTYTRVFTLVNVVNEKLIGNKVNLVLDLKEK